LVSPKHREDAHVLRAQEIVPSCCRQPELKEVGHEHDEAKKRRPEEIESLLPWHAAGTLSRRDAERVERAAGERSGARPSVQPGARGTHRDHPPQREPGRPVGRAMESCSRRSSEGALSASPASPSICARASRSSSPVSHPHAGLCERRGRAGDPAPGELDRRHHAQERGGATTCASAPE